MKIEQLFFELLQVAVGNRKKLSHIPSKSEWKELFELSKKQALTPIAFTGVTKLIRSADSENEGSDFGASLGMDEVTYLKWLGLTAKVAQRNKELNAECAKVCTELVHDGLQCCVLKGQSNLVNYPEDLRECRTAGDIDLWTLPHPEGIPIAVASGDYAEYVNYKDIAGVVEYAQQWRRLHNQDSIPWHRVLYYHVKIDTDSGTEVELHYRPSFLNSPLRNRRLQSWFRENEQFCVCDFETNTIKTPSTDAGSMSPLSDGCQSASVSELPASYCQTSACIVTDTASDDGKKQEINNSLRKNAGQDAIPVPTVSFNAVYQLCHIYRHLFDEGIGLRQLLDYYFVLRALHIEQGSLADRTESMAQWAEGMGVAVKGNAEIMHTLGRFGMKKFAGAVMWVIAKVFANDDDNDTLRYDNWASRWPWMICEPNEKEGKFLLNEIMMAGNFGKYDTRISHSTSQMGHAWEKLKHNMRLVRHYPEEVLWEPFFRLYHWIWRRFELWR